MKRLIAVALTLTTTLASMAQTGYVVDPTTKKRITYKVEQEKILFSNGKVALPSISSTDFKRAYLTAAVPVVTAPPVVIPPVTTPPVTTPVSYTLVGTGSGNLDLGDVSGKNIKIKPGSYGYISIARASKSKVDGTGVSLEKMYLTEGNTIEIFGFAFHNQKYRPLEISKLTKALYLHDLSFTNTGDYTIAYYYEGIWDKTDATATTDWRIDKCTFSNTGPVLTLNGGFQAAGIKNLIKNFTFSNNIVKDGRAVGNAIYLGAADDYKIFGNTFSNLNADVNNHNGLLHLIGNGAVYNNTAQRYQGNLVRAWGVSFGSVVKTIEIYGNKAYETRKYSAFELQATPELQEYLVSYPTRIAVTNAKVYNNTVGLMNTAKDWEGQILDLYNTGGTLEFYNNLGFDLYTNGNGGQITTMINNMSDTRIIKNQENWYFNTQKEAVSSLQDFKSIIKGVGAQ